MKILVIGTGYVGLVTGACFAEMGHVVTCLDIDPKKIASLSAGKVPFFEPGLAELVERSMKEGRLFFTIDYTKTKEADVIFLALPTPPLENGECDLSALFASARTFAPLISKNSLIVVKSTVPVGTCAKLSELLPEFDIVSNPEFLKEGNAVQDCLKPDRIVIGSNSERGIAIMKELYLPFTLNHSRILIMDIPSSEMTKYASNAMLATRISFMNELSHLCEKTGANIHNVRIGMGADSRIGTHFLYAGIGFGGSCFPKDLKALKSLAKKLDCETALLDAVDAVNEKQRKILSQKLLSYFGNLGGIEGKTIAIWGLSFKPDTDDLREAPALEIISSLLERGAKLRLFDPVSMNNAALLFQENHALSFCKDAYDAAAGSDAIALITEWKQFRSLDFDKVRHLMKGAGFFDGRNQYNPHEMTEKGFDYFGIGVPHAKTSL